jgi:cysteine desulfurase
MAISHDRNNALSSWRISLSHLTTDGELERFIEILDEIISQK